MFRAEAIAINRNHLSGDVAIAVPIAWQTIGYLSFGGVTTGMLFLSFASYSRVETVNGLIVPDSGVSSILPTRSGIIAGLAVHDGQNVIAGAELAAIRAEEENATGTSAAALIESAIARQDVSLGTQSDAVQAAAFAQQGQLAAQQAGLGAEISQIQSQVGLQRELIASAQKDFDRAKSIADRGFISLRDLQFREETLLSRQQGLSQLTQSLAAKQASLAETQRSAAQLSAQARGQSANLAAARKCH